MEFLKKVKSSVSQGNFISKVHLIDQAMSYALALGPNEQEWNAVFEKSRISLWTAAQWI